MLVPMLGVAFLQRAEWMYSGRTVVVDGGRRLDHAEYAERTPRLSSALVSGGAPPVGV